jgi:hypothetical protein
VRPVGEGGNLDTLGKECSLACWHLKRKHGSCGYRYPDDMQLGSWGKKMLPPRACDIVGVVVVVVVVTAEFCQD